MRIRARIDYRVMDDVDIEISNADLRQIAHKLTEMSPDEMRRVLSPSAVRDTAIRSMLKAGATLESVARCAGISFAAASRLSGYTTSFRNVQACYFHNHPHAEAADEIGD